MLDPDDAVPIATLRLRRPAAVHPDTSVFEVLNIFQTGRALRTSPTASLPTLTTTATTPATPLPPLPPTGSHMAIVSEDADLLEACWKAGEEVPPDVAVLGVCTIEDVVEEMIGEEIIDETDYTEQSLAAARESPREIQRQRSAPQMPVTPRSEAERAAPFGPKDPLLSEA